jgi:hypothetical protein
VDQLEDRATLRDLHGDHPTVRLALLTTDGGPLVHGALVVTGSSPGSCGLRSRNIPENPPGISVAAWDVAWALHSSSPGSCGLRSRNIPENPPGISVATWDVAWALHLRATFVHHPRKLRAGHPRGGVGITLD